MVKEDRQHSGNLFSHPPSHSFFRLLNGEIQQPVAIDFNEMKGTSEDEFFEAVTRETTIEKEKEIAIDLESLIVEAGLIPQHIMDVLISRESTGREYEESLGSVLGDLEGIVTQGEGMGFSNLQEFTADSWVELDEGLTKIPNLDSMINKLPHVRAIQGPSSELWLVEEWLAQQKNRKV